MKKKRNFLLLILAVLLIGLGAGSTTVSAFSLPKLQNAESGCTARTLLLLSLHRQNLCQKSVFAH